MTTPWLYNDISWIIVNSSFLKSLNVTKNVIICNKRTCPDFTINNVCPVPSSIPTLGPMSHSGNNLISLWLVGDSFMPVIFLRNFAIIVSQPLFCRLVTTTCYLVTQKNVRKRIRRKNYGLRHIKTNEKLFLKDEWSNAKHEKILIRLKETNKRNGILWQWNESYNFWREIFVICFVTIILD